MRADDIGENENNADYQETKAIEILAPFNPTSGAAQALALQILEVCRIRFTAVQLALLTQRTFTLTMIHC